MGENYIFLLSLTCDVQKKRDGMPRLLASYIVQNGTQLNVAIFGRFFS